VDVAADRSCIIGAVPTLSAALLLHRVNDMGEREVLLVHPGGPLWARKDAGAWSIPKGEYVDGEEPEAAARREFAEELGLAVPAGDVVALGSVTQPSRKIVTAFALAADLDLTEFRSNTFELPWPPKSGTLQRFPEVDRAEWFTLDDARVKLLKGQLPFLDTLLTLEG
jgi:predicted NUDIX family NTP pyrophosphohydrolase